MEAERRRLAAITVIAQIAGTVLVAVAEEVGEAALVLGPFDLVVTELAAGEGVHLALGRCHRLGVDVAVFVRRRQRVARDAEGVPRLAADTEVAVGASKVDGRAAVANLDVVCFRNFMSVSVHDLAR